MIKSNYDYWINEYPFLISSKSLQITEEISSVNVDSNNEEDSESVLDEDTVTGDVPVQHDHPLERPTKLDPSSDAVEAHS